LVVAIALNAFQFQLSAFLQNARQRETVISTFQFQLSAFLLQLSAFNFSSTAFSFSSTAFLPSSSVLPPNARLSGLTPAVREKFNP
jgi:hypothetical protein